MSGSNSRFEVPSALQGDTAKVLAEWQALLRAENPLPFADDLGPSLVPSPDAAIVLHVFRNPLRFRIEQVGKSITAAFGRDVSGKFADEFADRSPFEEFEAQCREAVSSRRPTFYRSASGYERLVLPFWGDGYVSTLLSWVSRP